MTSIRIEPAIEPVSADEPSWTAEVTAKEQVSPLTVAFTVVFTNTATKETQTQVYKLNDPAALSRTVANQIAAYEKAASAVDVPLGRVELPAPPTPKEPPPPPDPARTQFRADVVRLWRLLDAQALGILADTATMSELQSALSKQVSDDPTLLDLAGKPFG